ncbi:TraR/DksA C4-type zinc finger protein [Candidatus Kaiserbacteria bacterium]|nr:TraR/DksA C4-type zinc finger protein [Candidatus Kaiserbacteria bacterium]
MKSERFKDRLQAEKAALESSLATVGRKNENVPGDWEPVPPEGGAESDPADQADIITSRENDAAVLADLEARYDMVLAALSRIEAETYGICEICGKPIEEARLEADPAATTCIAHR